jgi:predicted unusual protein kinase regulating ubiquinone biosynthesis (AarF/ABC1/UbiB family)
MSSKPFKIKRKALHRSLGLSLAGLRVGGALALDSALGKLKATNRENGSAFAQREAERFVKQLGRLKGSYVKIGQMLALLGEHFLPPVLTNALHSLEANTQPLAWSEIEADVRNSLGDRYIELDIDPVAIAAASLAQVHRATIIKTGEEICLKIQYPGLAEIIDADFDAVVRMLVLAKWIKKTKDLDAWLEFMRQQLHYEIDYVREAEMTLKMQKLTADSNAETYPCKAQPANRQQNVAFYVPKVFGGYSTGTILALEFIQGHKVNHVDILNLSQEKRNAFGISILKLFFLELFDWGVMQTDPNFGNYLLQVCEQQSGDSDKLVLLDFGSCLECDEATMQSLGQVILSGQSGNREAVAKSLYDLGWLQPEYDEDAVNRFVDFSLLMLEPLYAAEDLPKEYLNQQGKYCWGQSKLLKRVAKMAAGTTSSKHFTAPSKEFSMITRKLLGVFTFITVLNAEFNACDILEAFRE